MFNARRASERDTTRSFLSGCLAAPVGFGLSAIVLIPLWFVYPFSTGDSSAIAPTLFSFATGVGYAVLMSVIAAAGLPRRWWAALLFLALGVAYGAYMGVVIRTDVLNGCQYGSGPQPDYCHQDDPPFLRPIVPLYITGCSLLGLALWVAGAIRVGYAPEDDDAARPPGGPNEPVQE